MAKTLKQNVTVVGVTYGPDYPQNEVTSDVLDAITNEAVFADAEEAPGQDNRTRADDFGTDEPPNLAERAAAGPTPAQTAEATRQEKRAAARAKAEAPPDES